MHARARACALARCVKPLNPEPRSHHSIRTMRQQTAILSRPAEARFSILATLTIRVPRPLTKNDRAETPTTPSPQHSYHRPLSPSPSH